MYSNAIKVSKTDVIYKQYVTYRNLLNKIKKTSKFQHYRQILQEYKYDMKNTWRTLNNTGFSFGSPFIYIIHK